MADATSITSQKIDVSIWANKPRAIPKEVRADDVAGVFDGVF